jgi:Lysylphosphatidylglycerol synthase TM region
VKIDAIIHRSQLCDSNCKIKTQRPRTSSMKKSIFHAVQLVSFAAGVALFVYLLQKTGASVLINNLEKLGWGFLLIVALSGVRNFVRAGSWYAAIGPDQRAISFWRLTNVMLAGEAIKYLTATGPILGEPAKAAMIRREIPLLQGFSSVLIENLIYYLTVFVFMFAGLPSLLVLAETPGKVKLSAYVLMALIAAGVGLTSLAIRYRWYVLARGLKQLGELTGRLPSRLPGFDTKSSSKSSGKSVPDINRLETLASQVRLVEDNLYNFYERRRSAFYLIFWLNMVAHLINVVEVYVILLLLQLPSSLVLGFLVEAVTKVINLVFFFVPARAGVYESGNALLLQSLGMSAAAGVALAIIRKLRAFVWAGYGLIIIGIASIRRQE